MLDGFVNSPRLALTATTLIVAMPAFVNREPRSAAPKECGCYNLQRHPDLDAAMMKPACAHKRTQLIAKDNDAHYVECLDCGEILEAGEMETIEKKDPAGFDGSL